MKRILITSLILSCLLLSACNDSTSVGVIGGADGPTSIFVSSENGDTVKKPLRMIKVDGKLYYDSGKVSDMTPRCGTLDGESFSAKGGLMEYLSKGIRACPTLLQKFETGNAANMNTGCGGYGYNKMLGGEMVYGTYNVIPIAKVTQVQHSTRTIAFSDSVQFDSYSQKPIEMFYISPPFGDWNGYPYDCYPDMHFRHNRKANVGFVDGHVKAEQLTITRSSFFSEADNLTKYFIGWFGKDFDDAQTWFTIKK